jgi:Bcr/CflA subfamily drug resistance transporter
MEKQINKKFIPIIMTIAVVAMQSSIDIHLPSMPAIRDYFHTTGSITQLSITMLLLGTSFPQLVFGPLSDRFGRRPIFILGAAIFLAAAIACVFAPDIETFLTARFIQGCGCAAISVPYRAAFRDAFSGAELVKAFSFVAIIYSVTPVLAPILGAFIQTYFGWKVNFVLLIALGAITLTLVILYFPETQAKEHRQALHLQTILKNYKTLLTSRNFLGFSLIGIIALGFLFGFSTAAPFILQAHMGLTPIQYAFSSLFVALGYMISSHLNKHFSHVIKTKTVLLIAPIAMLIINLTAYFLADSGNFTVATFIIPNIALFFCLGFLYPHCMTGAMTFFPYISGIAGALFGCINFLGTSAISGMIAHLPGNTLAPMNLFFVILSAISVLVYFTITAKVKMPD